MAIGFKPEDTFGKVKRRFGWVVVVGVCVCVLLWFIAEALINMRRYTLATASDGAVYQTDRLTGKTWRVEGQAMTEVAKVTPTLTPTLTPTPTPDPDAPQELPVDDVIKLKGKGDCIYKYGDWRFEATVNNPTDWTIFEFRAFVAGEAYEFTEYWPPSLSIKIQVNKLKSYTPSESEPSKKCSWTILSAKGRKPSAEKKGAEDSEKKGNSKEGTK